MTDTVRQSRKREAEEQADRDRMFAIRGRLMEAQMTAEPIPNELIGNLLDHWEQLPNDLKGDLAFEQGSFYRAIKQLQKWVEANH